MNKALLFSLALVGSVASAAPAPAPAQSLAQKTDFQLTLKIGSDLGAVFASCPAEYGSIATQAIQKAVAEARQTKDEAERKQKAAALVSEALGSASDVNVSKACSDKGAALVQSSSEAAKRMNTNLWDMVNTTVATIAKANAELSEAAAPKK